MTLDPGDFAVLAERLRAAADEGVEPVAAAHRIAIGRYYYAVLLGARDYLAHSEPNPVDTSADTHGWVIRKLRDSAEPEAQKLASDLNTMRLLRNKADYGQHVADLGGEAKRMASRCGRSRGYVAALSKRHGS